MLQKKKNFHASQVKKSVRKQLFQGTLHLDQNQPNEKGTSFADTALQDGHATSANILTEGEHSLCALVITLASEAGITSHS